MSGREGRIHVGFTVITVRLRLANGECKVGTFIWFYSNHVGMRGRLALSAAVKIKNRALDFIQFFSSTYMNALFPRGYTEGFKRTFKHEAYSYLHAEYHRDHHARSTRDLLVDAQEDLAIRYVGDLRAPASGLGVKDALNV